MKKKLHFILAGIIFFLPPLFTSGQGPVAPGLGAAACYAIFSANGDVSNVGITYVTGDVGTNRGGATGFNPLTVTGTIHAIPDASTANAAVDLVIAYNFLNALPVDVLLPDPAQFGNNMVLTPKTYELGAATTLSGNLYLNAGGNTHAIFVIKVKGALSAVNFSKVILTNGAQSNNIYWQVEGAVSINASAVFHGTIIANNAAITLAAGDSLYGRAFTTTGAITVTENTTLSPYVNCSGCTEYRSLESNLWSLPATWEVNNLGSWAKATNAPLTGSGVTVRHIVKQDINFMVSNCPLILESNGASSLLIEPGITLGFSGGTNGNAYFNNRPVVVRSTINGTGAIGAMLANSKTSGDENVQLERFLPEPKRRWNLLTPGVINGTTLNTSTTLRDAWAGGSQDRVANSNNRAGAIVYDLGNPAGGKPENLPFPLYANDAKELVSHPLSSGFDPARYTPYTGTIITGHRNTSGSQAGALGFDWWDELIIPQGSTFYISPTETAVAQSTRTTPSSIRPYRPNAATDFGEERGTHWVSNSTLNSDPAKDGKSIVQLTLNELDNGYMLFTRGDRRVLENWYDSTTLRPVGKIRSGNVEFSVFPGTQQLTVLPNPYPAPISLEKLFSDPDNAAKLGLTAHVWNSNIDGANKLGGWVTLLKNGNSWLAAPATGGGNKEIISSSQAFLVEGSGTGGMVTFRESMKANLSEVNFLPFETEGSESGGKAGILITNINNRSSTTGALAITDGVGILLGSQFTAAATDNCDVKKVYNFEGGKSLALLRNGNALAFDAHPDPAVETVFPLQANHLGQSKFAFTFHPTDLEKDGREAWLKDKFLGTESPISLTSPSQYNFEGNANAASLNADRFEIVFKQSEILPVTFTAINAVEQGKHIRVSWNVATEDKMSHYEVEHSINGTEFGKAVKVDANNTSPAAYEWLHIQPGAGDHFYRVRAFNLEGRSLLTKVVKLTLGNHAPGFKAFPTVVSTASQVTLQLISLDKGSYTLQVTDITGKTISARTIEHSGGSASLIMQMPPSLSAGKYNIRLTGTSGSFVQPVVKD